MGSIGNFVKPKDKKLELKFKKLDPKTIADQMLKAINDPDATAKLERELDAYLEGLSEADRKEFNTAYAGWTDKAIAASPDIDPEKKKQMQKLLKGKAAVQALGAGASLFQILEAGKKKKKLVAPKLPADLQKNSDLATQLNSAKVRQGQGDPELRRILDSKLSEQEFMSNEVAKTSGQTGRFVANAQANSLRKDKSLQQFLGREAERESQRRAETNGLIGQSIKEDHLLKNQEYRKYGIEQNAYSSSLSSLQAQQNSGMQNLFYTANNLAGAIPGLSFDGNQKPLNLTMEDGSQMTRGNLYDPRNLERMTGQRMRGERNYADYYKGVQGLFSGKTNYAQDTGYGADTGFDY